MTFQVKNSILFFVWLNNQTIYKFSNKQGKLKKKKKKKKKY